MSSAKEFLENREKEKKKAREAILSDFNALQEALPTLEQLIEERFCLLFFVFSFIKCL